jgi:UDP-N-acetylglucosamine 2-epimerase (non-hydrolysing)
MTILTITGTRPELIRLSIIIKKLDEVCEHVHVHTSQNSDPCMRDVFIKELKLKEPKYMFPKKDTLGEFLSYGFQQFEKILDAERPDKVLILGDTNSVLFGVLAAKRGIPIYHMEAGNRCGDTSVPEETNRTIIDACSRYNLPYTENSKENLIREGHSKNFVFKTGNPIHEVLKYYEENVNRSLILQNLGLLEWDFGSVQKPYALLTFHRTENVDNPERARNVVEAINFIADEIPVVFSYHPRTRDQFRKHGLTFSPKVITHDPVGFFDFVQLERMAKVVFTDSGTVPEETSIFGVPTIVLRNTTERQELMENGTCILAGTNKKDILTAYHGIGKMRQKWLPLPDYDKMNVSDTVIRLLLGSNM